MYYVNISYLLVITDIKLQFSFRKTLISKCFFMRFLSPSHNIPHKEKILSTNACDAGALIRS